MDHIRSVVMSTTTNDNKDVVIRAKNNLSINKCTIVNRGIIRVKIDFVCNKESNNALI